MEHNRITDEELVNILVDHNLAMLRLQRKFINDPMAQPPLLPSQRKYFDELWDEAIARNLHEIVHKLVREKYYQNAE